MIISIDVGIKNLSMCILDEYATIQKWEVIDLCQSLPSEKCEYTGKKGPCKHNATYTVAGNIFFCNVHVKKSEYANCIAPDIYYKMLKQTLSKKKVSDLNTIYSLVDNTQDQLVTHIYNVNATKLPSSCRAKDMDLIDIGRTLSRKLTESIHDFSNIKTVLIENQISPIATRMKCIQGMISQYFIEKNIYDIHFISSSNKLKHYDVPKKTYQERKKSSIIVTEDLLSEQGNNNKWLSIFKNHIKMDDLADSYLQGLWFITFHTKQIA